MAVAFCELIGEWLLAILPVRLPAIKRALVGRMTASPLHPSQLAARACASSYSATTGRCSRHRPTIDWALVGLVRVLSACLCMPRSWPLVLVRALSARPPVAVRVTGPRSIGLSSGWCAFFLHASACLAAGRSCLRESPHAGDRLGSRRAWWASEFGACACSTSCRPFFFD